MKKYKLTKKKIWSFTTVILLLGLFSVSLYNDSKIEFLTTENREYHDIISSPGIVVRDEELLEFSSLKDMNGLVFNYYNGEKVSKGAAIATAYESAKETKEIYKLQSLEEKVNDFKNLSASISHNNSESINVLNHRINSSIESLALSLNSDFSNFLSIRKKLWYLLNKKSMSMGKSNNFKAEITRLEEKVKELKDKKPSGILDIYTLYDGRFIRYTDGFEKSFDFKKSFDLKEPLDNIKPETYDFKPLGKIIKSETWYAVFTVSKAEAEKIQKASSLNLSLTGVNSLKNLPAKLESVNLSGNDYTLVLSCDRMNQSVAYLRKETFKIETGNYPGIKINKRALHKNAASNSFGVYVKYGNYLKFKNVDILFADSEFVVCDYSFNHYSDENYLQPGDKVAYTGKGLFEGKHI